MLSKKKLVPFIILSLLFANLILAEVKTNTTSLDSSSESSSAEVVKFQQLLNDKGFWFGTTADGLVELQLRQAPSLAATDSSSASTPILAENTPQSVNSVTEPSESANKSTVKVAEKPAATVSRGTSASPRSGKVITMVSTAYDGCYECNKPYYGYPSYIGLPLKHGIVAVDPDVIPMGTRLYVEGYGDAIAADQGNAIKGNRIDLFFDTHQQALDYGMKTVKVTILD